MLSHLSESDRSQILQAIYKLECLRLYSGVSPSQEKIEQLLGSTSHPDLAKLYYQEHLKNA